MGMVAIKQIQKYHHQYAKYQHYPSKLTLELGNCIVDRNSRNTLLNLHAAYLVKTLQTVGRRVPIRHLLSK
jgi:hypothetical protein